MEDYSYSTHQYTFVTHSFEVPRPRFSRRGANPTLETIEYMEAALRAADRPTSRNELLSVLASWGHSTTRQSLNAALAFLGEQGVIAEGSKGLVYVPAASPELLRAIREGPRM